MTTEQEQAIAEIVAAIQRGEIPDGVRVCRPFGGELPGPSRDVIGWQDEAGEEDQSVPGWDSL